MDGRPGLSFGSSLKQVGRVVLAIYVAKLAIIC